MVNGYLAWDVQSKHVVEIQLHLSELLAFRDGFGGSISGGHELYSTFRSLSEAIETTYGKHVLNMDMRSVQWNREAESPHPRPKPLGAPPPRTPPRRPLPPPNVNTASTACERKKGENDTVLESCLEPAHHYMSATTASRYHAKGHSASGVS